jgi:hypothetical protein
MAVAFVRATYTEEVKLQQFLTGLFGYGKTSVIWKRGRYQCTVPRRLTLEEIGRLREVVTIEHYDQA